MLFSSFLVQAFFAILSSAQVFVSARPHANLTVYDTYRFPTNNLVENLAVRENGRIIVTEVLPTAALYEIDPVKHTSILADTLPFANGTYGIDEFERDVFYVATGNITASPLGGVVGSWTVWKVDMNPFKVSPNGTVVLRSPIIEKAISLPKAQWLNGLVHIPGSPDLGLTADITAGLVWRFNVCTGEVSIAIQDESMTSPANATLPLGVNGLKIHKGYLYYTNSARASFYRMPIHGDGSSAGPAELLASNLAVDDCILDTKGNAYIVGPLDVVTLVTVSGKVSQIAGTFNSMSSALVSPTAIRFGRTKRDASSLYITTNDGAFGLIIGTQGLSRIDVLDHA